MEQDKSWPIICKCEQKFRSNDALNLCKV